MLTAITVEEKYGKQVKPTANGGDNDDEIDDDDDSTSEEEDDAGELATEALDAEMFDVLNAIRSKDPRVYDKTSTFYGEQAEDKQVSNGSAKKERPMNLRDYHRMNLLSGSVPGEGEDEEQQTDGAPKSYAQEQRDLKDSIVASMHATADDSSADGNDEDEDAFLVAKNRPLPSSTTPKKITPLQIENAEKDPDTFLSNFMASRAWVPTTTSAYAPLESDDEEQDAMAEAFETAYNRRFEDPNEANKTLTTHARSAVDKYSVRREELSGRQKGRERDKLRRDEEREEREQERARLKKLMVDEMQEKADKIREAANLRGEDFKIEEWVGILNEDWDDRKWEKVLTQKFGDDYYAEEDGNLDDDIKDQDGDGVDSKTQAKERKPKWDDDIDIKDIIPDFQDEDDRGDFSLSEEEDASVDNGTNDEVIEGTKSTKKKSKDRKKDREEKKKAAKRDHRILDAAAQQLLDESAAAATNTSSKKSKRTQGPQFRYRATSPSAYGLTPLEILTADDAQLNGWVGLKKLYPFRDEEKKRKDKKRMSKKGRLREWRKDTFGDREGPRMPEPSKGVEDGRVEKSKKKRRRKGKTTAVPDQSVD